MKNSKYLSVSVRDLLVLLDCLVLHVTWYVCDVCCLDLTSHARVLFLQRKWDSALCIL